MHPLRSGPTHLRPCIFQAPDAALESGLILVELGIGDDSNLYTAPYCCLNLGLNVIGSDNRLGQERRHDHHMPLRRLQRIPQDGAMIF